MHRSVLKTLLLSIAYALLAGTPTCVAADAVPKVLWVYRTDDHFIASPVLDRETLFVSGLAGLNSGFFRALNIDPQAEQRIRWAKSALSLKLPVVSAPAVTADGQVIFGNGMHQTDGAALRSLDAATGKARWEYYLPGRLVHMEGTPAIAVGKAYIGAGSGGVLCVDFTRLSLDGRESPPAEIAAQLDQRWQELLAAYEKEKQKDPDLAIPPSDDSLPKPAPKLVWQQGKDSLHVDAGVTLDGDRLYAASAHLDEEQLGDRSLLCLDASTGRVHWQTPLKHNAWGAPQVHGNLLLVGTSSIRFDPDEAKRGRGEVLAINKSDGTVKWRKAVLGGIVSSLAVGDVAISTASDGRVQAYDLETGRLRWGYNAAAPLFAGPALGPAETVYAADLRGVVHAINTRDGKPRWTLDLAKHPDAAPGMVYGTPLVAGKKLYVTTCNIHADGASGGLTKAGVVACIELPE